MHARIEKDWREYAGGNEDVYTPLESILAAVQQSGLCRITVILTGDVAAAEALCRNDVCDTFNNSGLEYYIQASLRLISIGRWRQISSSAM